MTYNVMTDGLVHSRHETEESAQAEIKRVTEDVQKTITTLKNEIFENQEYIESLKVEEEQL